MSKNALNFEASFPGLQILWNDFQELEFIPVHEIIEGSRNSTLTKNIMSGALRRIEYPIQKDLDGRLLKIIYRSPPNIKGYEVEPGETRIHFRDLSLKAIEKIEWYGYQTKVLQPLVRKRTWNWIVNSSYKEELFELARIYKTTKSVYRPKQSEFRKDLLFVYQGCVITGEKMEEAIEACHIIPVKKNGKEVFSNGIPLRSDLHKLYDAGYFEFNPNSEFGKIEIKKPESICKYYRNMLEEKGHLDSKVIANIRLALKLKMGTVSAPKQK